MHGDSSNKVHGPKPRIRWALAILAAILFPPLGLVALFFGLKSGTAYRHGHLAEAQHHAASSLKFLRYSGAAFLIMMMVVFSLQFAFFSAATEVIPEPGPAPVSDAP